MINSIQYEAIKLGNYNTLNDILKENFNIKCNNVIINDDHIDDILDNGTFFGIFVIPNLSSNIVKKVYNCNIVTDATENDNEDRSVVKYNSYSIEIDSRVFDLLNHKQFYTYLEYEINKFENIEALLKDYFDKVTIYTSHCGITTIKQSRMIELDILYRIMTTDYLINSLSLLSISHPSLIEDEELLEVYNILKAKSGDIRNYNTNDFLFTGYLLKTIDSIDKFKANTIAMFERLVQYCPIRIYKKLINTIVYNIEKLNHVNISVSATNESVFNLKKSKMYLDFRKAGARQLEDKFYEISIEAKAIKDKDDAMMVLREINSSIRILDALISTPDIDSYTIDRYEDLRIRYMNIRDVVLSNRRIEDGVNIITLNDLLKGKFTV